MTETVVWHKKPEHYQHYHDNDLDQDQVDLDDEDDDDDIPPEVPKRTSSKGIGSVTLASSTSASGRSSAGSMSIRGQVKSAGNGVANNEPRQPRMCSATGRPLVEWSSESTLGASERVRRHRLHHHHHYYHHHHHGHQLGHASSYPRRAGVPVQRKPVASAAQVSAMRQVASADEASDSEEIDVCETCSEWLSKALLCSCQVPSSASSSPSQGQELLKGQLPSQAQVHHHQQQQHHRSYKTYQQPARGIVRS